MILALLHHHCHFTRYYLVLSDYMLPSCSYQAYPVYPLVATWGTHDRFSMVMQKEITGPLHHRCHLAATAAIYQYIYISIYLCIYIYIYIYSSISVYIYISLYLYIYISLFVSCPSFSIFLFSSLSFHFILTHDQFPARTTRYDPCLLHHSWHYTATNSSSLTACYRLFI
jgi:hypothetical protein